MRWRFIDPKNSREMAERAAITSKIDFWWREFQSQADEIVAHFFRKAKWNLPGWMEEHLESIEQKLMWEFGPAVRGEGHHLVITPESSYHLRPLVQTILERAPLLADWEFYEYRLAEDPKSAKSAVQGRTGGDITDFKVRVSLGDQQRIDLVFTAPTIADENDQTAFDTAFVITESHAGLDHEQTT